MGTVITAAWMKNQKWKPHAERTKKKKERKKGYSESTYCSVSPSSPFLLLKALFRYFIMRWMFPQRIYEPHEMSRLSILSSLLAILVSQQEPASIFSLLTLMSCCRAGAGCLRARRECAFACLSLCLFVRNTLGCKTGRGYCLIVWGDHCLMPLLRSLSIM